MHFFCLSLSPSSTAVAATAKQKSPRSGHEENLTQRHNATKRRETNRRWTQIHADKAADSPVRRAKARSEQAFHQSPITFSDFLRRLCVCATFCRTDFPGYVGPVGGRERIVGLNLGETNHPLGFHIPNFQTQTTEDFHWIE